MQNKKNKIYFYEFNSPISFTGKEICYAHLYDKCLCKNKKKIGWTKNLSTNYEK